MEIESIKSVGKANSGAAYVPPVSDASGNSVKVVNDTKKVADTTADNAGQTNQNQIQEQVADGKKVAQSTIDNTISATNSKIKMSNTQLQYSIDEETQRISIKIIDKDTDKVIREVPPDETLEAIKKIWEIAGIIVDEKR